jgi:hypothetical protein
MKRAPMRKGKCIIIMPRRGLATTKSVLKALACSGFLWKCHIKQLEVVARRTIDKSLRKRRVYIPGTLNRIFSVAGRFLPVTMVTSVIYM